MFDPARTIDAALLVWFTLVALSALSALSALYVLWDASTRNPELRVMRVGWVLVTFYTGPIGGALYVLSCQEPAPGTHARFIAPLWKQALGMNAVMAGMIPVMVVLMTRHMSAMEPMTLRFWGVMSLASIVGLATAYPANVWLVAAKLKHGMGTERVLGSGGTSVVDTPSGQERSGPVRSAARLPPPRRRVDACRRDYIYMPE